MNKVAHLFQVGILILFFACSRNPGISIDQEKLKILELYHAQRDHHFNKDSLALADQLSDNFISVNRGVVSSPSREETISRYNGYFSAVEFIKWDDVSEPVINFSDDGSMAYMIVDKLVSVTYTDEEGNEVEGETHFAWTAIYRKYADEWMIDCITSTEQPALTK